MLGTRYIVWENRPVPDEALTATVEFAIRGLSTDAPLAPLPWPQLAADKSATAAVEEREAGQRDESAGERTRRRLLAAAEQCFGQLGFFHAQIADITRLAGVAQGTFYVHFPDKGVRKGAAAPFCVR